jgi:hypothetical protein
MLYRQLIASVAMCALSACMNHPATQLKTIVAPKPPNPAPSNLDALVRLDLPTVVKTIGEATTYVLSGTGYQFVDECQGCSAYAKIIAQDPISPLGFMNETMTLKRALLMIAGGNIRLVIDEKHKMISYEPIEAK